MVLLPQLRSRPHHFGVRWYYFVDQSLFVGHFHEMHDNSVCARCVKLKGIRVRVECVPLNHQSSFRGQCRKFDSLIRHAAFSSHRWLLVVLCDSILHFPFPAQRLDSDDVIEDLIRIWRSSGTVVSPQKRLTQSLLWSQQQLWSPLKPARNSDTSHN